MSKISIARNVVLVGLALFMLSSAGLDLKAQEGPPPVFGPQDVLPLFVRALSTADLIVFEDGSVVSGIVQSADFTLSSSAGKRSLARTDVAAIVFGNEQRNTSDRIFLRSGDQLLGQLDMEKLEVEFVLSRRASLDPQAIRAVLFQVLSDSEQQRHLAPPQVFRQLFGVFMELLVSVTKFETLIFSDGRVASVILANQSELAFTIQSTFFGTFTFKPSQIAWVIFAQNPNEPDQLVLQNGDRASGTVTADQDLQGRLVAVEEQFMLSKDELRAQVRQILFRIPVRLFGGGGGRPVKPKEH